MQTNKNRITSSCLFILFLFCSHLFAQNRIQVNIPSLEKEVESVWNTIVDIKFFEDNAYHVSLPKGELIEELKDKARKNQLSDLDQEALKSFMKSQVYDVKEYDSGYQRVKSEMEAINEMLVVLSGTDFTWGFKMFANYQINLTLYGPGGSFNPDEGSVELQVTTKGRFKSYDNASSTIIHEIVHIGIDASIVQKYKVSHALKERIVDLFVRLFFNSYLPNYTLQEMGEHRIDPFLTQKEDLKQLDKFVSQIMGK